MQRRAHSLIAGVLAALAAAEWLRGLASGWAWVAGLAGLAAALLAVRTFVVERPRTGEAGRLVPVLAALACLVVGLVLVLGRHRVRQIECCWPALREARVMKASNALTATLSDAITEARRLAERAAAAAWLPRSDAFDRVAAGFAAGPAGLERGVIVLDADGQPYAWAGRHRAVPAPDTAELRAVISPFYVRLEARRQTPNGRTAIGTVLLDAAPSVADRGGALSVRFAHDHGVALRFAAPHTAPPDSDLFDFCPRGCKNGDTLFSVTPEPPSQGDAKLAALSRIAGRASLALAAGLALLLVAAPPGRWRWLVVLVAGWTAARAFFGPAVVPSALFSPATFYRPLLRDFSASAGALLAVASLGLLGAAVLWRRGVARRWWGMVLAAVLLFYAPYLVRYLGRGIAPPATGVSFGLWLSWEAALAIASMTLVLLAAALVRGRVEPTRVPWTVAASCVWALLAGVAGLWLWSPSGAWPEWYTFLWLPALAGAVVPAPRRWALLSIATVAGTAAALVTWGASVEGRLALAVRDAQRLGNEPDPLAVAELERLGRDLLSAPAPASAADLYAVWAGSPLAVEDYPTVLASWDARGEELAELRLAAVDLSTPLLAALARSDSGGGLRVEKLDQIPGVHYVLTTRMAGDVVLTVGVGPRSRLVPASRVARFLRGERTVEPPYTINLSLPRGPVEPARVQWVRSGWTARGDRLVELPGGPRHVHVRVDLRGPWVLLVRGALVVLFDVALLAAAWALSRIVAEGWAPRRPALRNMLASYRGRLALALAAFFIAPVLAFAVWSFSRLNDTAHSSGDLLIRQTLRDAAASAGEPPPASTAGLAAAVADLGRRLDADLWTYQGGRLAGTTADVLAELGLVDPLLAPATYRRLTFEDEIETTVDVRTAGRPTRVGYRVVASGPASEQIVLAAPQLLDDETVRRRQEDLAMVLVLATLAGVIAAGSLARVTARTLAQPVAALREAALAVGRGAAPPPFPPDAPREFAPVLSAFERMAQDVRRSQAALEEARQRTAQVLANVATGVVAVDGELRVTMANPRAAELLGVALEPGAFVDASTTREWAPLWSVVREFLRTRAEVIVERELAIRDRGIRVQLAPLGDTGDGCVVALDDTTALGRAARVLAWGEMARQVAHEIKNPLTPIRLGIQHLERAWGRSGFERTLQETSQRILAEIDRLDTIARAFSRFGAPAAEQPALEAVDLHGLAREVVQLYALGDEADG
ncbi:MAG TPA: histidine kinase dimerization/phospho-acceptor domain-containing protein, partial [Gemmatimonadales bacterium]|nr:histidine kinase dimerization/phospho-acceptor domain-containing protein [Gemmatimonadales bacterium]